MKNFLFSILAIFVVALSISVTAHAENTQIVTNSTCNGAYYTETIITDAPCNSSISLLGSVQSISKTKTTYIKDSNGNTVWYVSLTATFLYDGNMAQCISCSSDAGVYHSSWSIKNCSSTKGGNSATAYATATYTHPSGHSQDYSQAVTLQCSPSGVMS